jgi:hypothetical protein
LKPRHKRLFSKSTVVNRRGGMGDRHLEAKPPWCYKSEMSKIVEQWLLFEYVGLEFTPLSKPFKTREQAEKAREKYPERLRKRIGVGVVRIKK